MYGQRRILKRVFCGRLCDIFTLLSWRIPRVERNHAAGADGVNLASNYLPVPVFHSLKPTCISAYCIDTYYKDCILVTPNLCTISARFVFLICIQSGTTRESPHSYRCHNKPHILRAYGRPPTLYTVSKSAWCNQTTTSYFARTNALIIVQIPSRFTDYRVIPRRWLLRFRIQPGNASWYASTHLCQAFVGRSKLNCLPHDDVIQKHCPI